MNLGLASPKAWQVTASPYRRFEQEVRHHAAVAAVADRGFVPYDVNCESDDFLLLLASNTLSAT